MVFCKDLLFLSIVNMPAQNILLLCSKSVTSSVLTPLSALRNFLFFFLLLESKYVRGDHHTDFNFRQGLNMNGPAERVIHQEQRRSPGGMTL